jgi:hypothetical protein
MLERNINNRKTKIAITTIATTTTTTVVQTIVMQIFTAASGTLEVL